MAFNALDWVNNKLSNENSQRLLVEAVTSLVEGPLKDKSDYAKEKALLSFSEGLTYLESLLLYQKGIHHNQLKPVDYAFKKEEIIKGIQEVEKTIEVEIKRQHRHFLLFLI